MYKGATYISYGNMNHNCGYETHNKASCKWTTMLACSKEIWVVTEMLAYISIEEGSIYPDNIKQKHIRG